MSVDVIIGDNYYHDFVLHRRLPDSRNEIIAVKTILVWTSHGPYTDLKHVSRESNDLTSVFCAAKKTSGSYVNSDLEKFWTLEGMNVPTEPENECVKPQLLDGRVSTSLPWKSDQRPTTNLPAVEIRQAKSEAKWNSLQQGQLYSNFQDLKQLQIIEPCPDIPPHNSWYLPHHCIWRKSSEWSSMILSEIPL